MISKKWLRSVIAICLTAAPLFAASRALAQAARRDVAELEAKVQQLRTSLITVETSYLDTCMKVPATVAVVGPPFREVMLNAILPNLIEEAQTRRVRPVPNDFTKFALAMSDPTFRAKIIRLQLDNLAAEEQTIYDNLVRIVGQAAAANTRPSFGTYDPYAFLTPDQRRSAEQRMNSDAQKRAAAGLVGGHFE